jgi:hypothetical protein
VCNAGRTGYAPSATCNAADLCDAKAGRCDVCVPGTWSCTGAELYHCASDGQSDPLSQTCASGATCDADAGTCDPPPPSDAGTPSEAGSPSEAGASDTGPSDASAPPDVVAEAGVSADASDAGADPD